MQEKQPPRPHQSPDRAGRQNEQPTAKQEFANTWEQGNARTDSDVGGPIRFPATFGRYRLEKQLGKGGMGAVFLAFDTQLDRRVAVKVPTTELRSDPRFRERFLREARAAATFSHPNICPVYDAGELDGVPYMTMAFIEGRPLSDFLRAKPQNPRAVAALIRQLALAMAEAHDRGIIHRDLKPANIMITPKKQPVITDFGLARRSGTADPQLTREGVAMGTPAYMPPEQFSGDAAAIGPAADIYSLGVIMYELLTGQRPFAGNPYELIGQLLTHKPKPPSSVRDGLENHYDAVCLKALAKDKEERHSSMRAFATAIEEAGCGRDVGKKAEDVSTREPTGSAEDLFAQIAAEPPQSLARIPKRRSSSRLMRWTGIGVIGIVVLIALWIGFKIMLPWRPTPQMALPWIERGDYFLESRPQESVEAYSAALKFDPTNAELFLRRGRAYFFVGKDQSAYSDFAQALQLAPAESPLRVAVLKARAQARDTFRQYDQAVEDWTELIRTAPNDDTLFVQRAKSHLNAGAVQKAVADYTEALRLKPDNADLYIERAACNESLADRDPSLAALSRQDYDEAIRRSPQPAKYYLKRAIYYANRNDLQKARADWLEALQRSPQQADTRDADWLKTKLIVPVPLLEPDAAKLVETQKYSGHSNSGVTAVVATTEGRVVSAGGEEVHVWKIASGQLEYPAIRHKEIVFAVAAAPDGTWAVSAGGRKTNPKTRMWERGSDFDVHQWNLSNGEQIRLFHGHTAPVNCAAVTPDGRLVVTASDDSTVRVWNAATGTQLYALRSGNRSAAVKSVVVGREGKVAVSGGLENVLRIWNLETGAEIGKGLHDDSMEPVMGCDVSPDGRRALTVGLDNVMRLWDLDLGVQIRAYGLRSNAMAVAFLPDGKRAIVTGGVSSTKNDKGVLVGKEWKWRSSTDDCVVRLIDLDLGEVLAQFPGLTPWCLALGPSGRTAVVGEFPAVGALASPAVRVLAMPNPR